MSDLFQKKQQKYDKDEFEAYGEYTYDYLHKAAPKTDERADGNEPPVQLEQPHLPRPKRHRRSLWLVFLVSLFLLTITLLVATETMFRVKAVRVIGAETKTPYEIVAISGIVKGESILGLEEKKIEEAFRSEVSIIYKGMKKAYPDTVYLYIEERKPAAVMRWIGMQYLLDETGLVMEEQSSMALPENMPIVTGFNVSNVNAGQQLMVKSVMQIEAYCEIMKELRLQLYTHGITEINLADPKSIYMITAEGVTVHLGDGQYIGAKICALRTYMGYLRQLGNPKGRIDVSIPEDAKYTPDG